jgi:cell division septation protein DedD
LVARNVNICFKHLALASAFCVAVSPATAEALRDSSTLLLAQAEVDPARAAPPQIHNIQRLLKLLADRYPKRYGSVDPGRVDGSFGAETKDAIRNFQKISGSKSTTQNGDQLVADILAVLAQMSATQAAADPASPTPEAVASAAPSPAPPVAAPAPAEAPKAEAPKAEVPNAETSAAVAPRRDTAEAGRPATVTPAAEARSAPAETSAKPSKAKTATPNAAAKGQRVYFVQAASLKSLDSAKREWRRIFDENRAALTGEQVYFERANVGDRGLFFRILIGPMSERDAAKTLCAFLQQNDQTCVVTSRDPADLQKTTSAAAPAPAKVAPETTGAPGRASAAVASAPEPESAKAPMTEAPTEAPATPAAASENLPRKATAPQATQGAAQPPDPPADDRGQVAPQSPIAGESAKPAAVAPSAESKAPSGQDLAPVAATPDGSGTAAASAGTLAAPPAPVAAPEPAAPPSPGAASAAAQPEPRPGSEPAPATSATGARANTPMDAARTLAVRLSQQPERIAGIAAALLIATGAAVYGWRRRNRRLSLSQFFQPASLPMTRAPSENTGPMDDLETDFGSDSLQQSRLARDAFLRDTLGPDTGGELTSPGFDSAMRINSSLKALLVKEPAQYKSIFLNWIFLAKVGSALDNKEISFEQLSDRISREFDLLQTYFKIHLLELDDRHRIRQELPGLFYCLQLTQMKKRQISAKFSAA